MQEKRAKIYISPQSHQGTKGILPLFQKTFAPKAHPVFRDPVQRDQPLAECLRVLVAILFDGIAPWNMTKRGVKIKYSEGE